jgi:hypothetical protein
VTEAAATEGREPGGRETGILMRVYRTVELLLTLHAKAARREASDDLRRVMSGALLMLVAFVLVLFALTLGHAAAVLAVERRFQWGYPASIGAVAGADLVLGWILFAVARARLRPPVLSETRALVKKTAAVLRG